MEIGDNMQDQTEPDWLEQANKNDLGTGIFLEKANGSVQKRYIENITYDECSKLGKNSIAFKWVPHFIASAQELKNNCPL